MIEEDITRSFSDFLAHLREPAVEAFVRHVFKIERGRQEYASTIPIDQHARLVYRIAD